jgi:spermidine/putrescine transport system substrate-binding protein
MNKKYKIWVLIGLLFLVALIGSACTTASEETANIPVEIVFRNWDGDIDPQIYADFTAETGIQVRFLPYDIQEDAVDEIRAGQVFDVVVLENQLIPALVADELLAEIHYQNVPNFKNISANFRDLAYDPQNKHSIPYSWGSTGLVVRTDLVEDEVNSWSVFWDPRYQGKVMAWTLSRYLIGATLQSLGYSLNSEVPAELDEAAQRLEELAPYIILRDWEPAVAAPGLVSGELVVAMGQADDVIESQRQGVVVEYIFPKEGGILWGDNFVIPANSLHQEAAEAFIDYLLRPEISAGIISETYYWLPNDPAMELIDPELRANTAIFPPEDILKRAEIMLPLTPEGETRYAQIWARFLAAGE